MDDDNLQDDAIGEDVLHEDDVVLGFRLGQLHRIGRAEQRAETREFRYRR